MSDLLAAIRHDVDELAAQDLSLLTRREYLEQWLLVLELEWALQLLIASLRAACSGRRRVRRAHVSRVIPLGGG
jgi:hypothetical protein